MIVVAHRRNQLEELAATPAHLGVEMDVRTRGDRLVVAHDPFEDGPDLEDWLDRYHHHLLIVNVKEEGLVPLVRPLLLRRGIDRFFFLGVPVPEQLVWIGQGEARFSVRVSEFHHPGTALRLAGRVAWVWLDGFHGFPVDAATARQIRDAGYEICLVSPELYGRDPSEIARYRVAAEATGVDYAAVCTRQWSSWAS